MRSMPGRWSAATRSSTRSATRTGGCAASCSATRAVRSSTSCHTFRRAEMADLTKEELTRLLKEAEAAHGEYEKAELGGVRDENWPAWYAEFIVGKLAESDSAPGSA